MNGGRGEGEWGGIQGGGGKGEKGVGKEDYNLAPFLQFLINRPFPVSFCLGFKTSPGAQPFIWK